MKFALRNYNSNTEKLQVSNNYHKVISNSKHVIYSGILLGFILMFLFILIINIFIRNIEITFYKKLYLILLLVPLHESIHLLFFPSLKNAEVGFYTKIFSFYVTTNDSLTKGRFLLISIAPFLFITVIPFIITCFYFNIDIVYLLLFNSLGAGVDILYFFIILKLPSVSEIKIFNNEIYYR